MSKYYDDGPFKIDQWNSLIRDINDMVADCDSDPLEEIEAPHIWAKTDIKLVQDKLIELCEDNEFEDIPDLWKQSSIDEIETAIELGPCCDCGAWRMLASDSLAIGPASGPISEYATSANLCNTLDTEQRRLAALAAELPDEPEDAKLEAERLAEEKLAELDIELDTCYELGFQFSQGQNVRLDRPFISRWRLTSYPVSAPQQLYNYLDTLVDMRSAGTTWEMWGRIIPHSPTWQDFEIYGKISNSGRLIPQVDTPTYDYTNQQWEIGSGQHSQNPMFAPFVTRPYYNIWSDPEQRLDTNDFVIRTRGPQGLSELCEPTVIM